MFNIFQGNDILRRNVAKTLGYDPDQKWSWFTKDMYFQTFFYLSKRFGNPHYYDDGKEAGAWGFKVKQYNIEIRMNGSWVEFMVYGKISQRYVDSPYIVKLSRERIKKRHLLLSEYGEWNATEDAIAEKLYQEFVKENNIDFTGIETQEQFNKIWGTKWFDRILEYNQSVIDVSFNDFNEKHGRVYENAYTRHAIRTLNQFLKNMLTPIWIRDVPYNIKGQLTDKEAMFYDRYVGNVGIEFLGDGGPV